MVKNFEMPKKCDDCSEELEELFCKCRTCDTYFCYNCLKKHFKHDFLECECIGNNEAAAVNLGFGGGYGFREGDEWAIIGTDAFYSNYHDKCDHAIDYFEKEEHIFFCNDCKIWLCKNCLNEHKGHHHMVNVQINDLELRQIDPNLYEANINLNINLQINKDSKNIILLSGELNNENQESIYDITASIIEYYTYEQYNTFLTKKELKPGKSINIEMLIINRNIKDGQILLRIIYHDIYEGMTHRLIKIQV